MTSPRYLKECWPLFLLGQAGQPTAGTPLNEQLIPASPADFRARLAPILLRTNPEAAAGLDELTDDQLAAWVRVLREPRLNGDLLLTPAWLSEHGQMSGGLARLLTLPFYERMDVLLHALHEKLHRQAAA